MVFHFNNTTVDIPVSDSSYRNRQIMGENALTLYISLADYIDIPIGAYCEYDGERYTLIRPASLVKNSSRNHEYTLVFEAEQSVLSKYKFRDTTSKRLKFSLTAQPQEHLQMLVDNLNLRGSGWSIGTCIEAIEKTLYFNHTYCADAFKMIAEAFQTEFEIVGKVVSLKKVEYNKESPLSLSYGKGNGFKYGVKRENFDQSKPVEILFVQGGEKNIDMSKYPDQLPDTPKSKDLLLPFNQELVYEGRTYVSDSLGYSIKRKESEKPLATMEEDSLDCSHIYPSRIGNCGEIIIVNADKNFYDIADETIPDNLNYTNCLIKGQKMTMIFQTGMLAGKEFDVTYHHAVVGTKKAKRFEIVPQTIDGVAMPNSTFTPIVGDKYAIFGINLPDAYICDNDTQTGASWDMFKEAIKYMYDNENPRFSFVGEIDGIWAKQHWTTVGPKIVLGGYVSFTDEQFQDVPVLIRITSIKEYVNYPNKPQIELSNVTAGSTVSSEIKKIATNDSKFLDLLANENQITKRGISAIDKSYAYLKSAMEDGSIDHDGGLLLGNLLFVKDLLGNITGGMSGLSDDPIAYFSGGDYDAALNGTAKIIFYKDGSWSLLGGKFKGTSTNDLISTLDNFKIDENGNVTLIGKLETKLNGNRIVIDNTDHSIKMYDNTNKLIVRIMDRHQNGFGNFEPNDYGFIELYQKSASSNDNNAMAGIELNPSGLLDNVNGYYVISKRTLSLARNDGCIFNVEMKENGCVSIKSDFLANDLSKVGYGEWYKDSNGFVRVR
ncbi:MAG: hypothetical protein WCK78_04160 [Paludibacter sp.]